MFVLISCSRCFRYYTCWLRRRLITFGHRQPMDGSVKSKWKRKRNVWNCFFYQHWHFFFRWLLITTTSVFVLACYILLIHCSNTRSFWQTLPIMVWSWTSGANVHKFISFGYKRDSFSCCFLDFDIFEWDDKRKSFLSSFLTVESESTETPF